MLSHPEKPAIERERKQQRSAHIPNKTLLSMDILEIVNVGYVFPFGTLQHRIESLRESGPRNTLPKLPACETFRLAWRDTQEA